MSNLNQYHPFRENINLHAKSGDSTVQSENTKSQDKDDIEYKPWFSIKTKIRFLIGLFALIIMWILVGDIFKDKPELEKGFYQTFNQSRNTAKEKVKKMEFIEDSDMDNRGRTVESTRAKYGWFESLFCRAGKRSFFCN